MPSEMDQTVELNNESKNISENHESGISEHKNSDYNIVENKGNNNACQLSSVPPFTLPKLNAISKNITILGRGETGKSSILFRYINKYFNTKITATPLESESIKSEIKNISIELKIFDTSGQDDYERFRTLTLPISDYAVIVYSVADALSFTEVEDTILSLIQSRAPEHVKIMLVAAKTDLKPCAGCDSTRGELLAKRIGAIKFIECSSITGENIDEIFEFIKNDAYKDYKTKLGEEIKETAEEETVEKTDEINQNSSIFSKLFCCC